MPRPKSCSRSRGPCWESRKGRTPASDISLSVDLLGTRIWATGSADKLQLLRELIPKIDKAPTETGEAAKEPEQLTLASYFIKSADSQLVLRVVQTLLADLPGVRLEVDATSGKMVAWARPSEHKIISDTLALLEGQDLQFEVIPLKRTDPQLAVAAINKFFGLTTATGDKKDAVEGSGAGPDRRRGSRDHAAVGPRDGVADRASQGPAGEVGGS